MSSSSIPPTEYKCGLSLMTLTSCTRENPARRFGVCPNKHLENKRYRDHLYEMHLLLNLSQREELENEVGSQEECGDLYDLLDLIVDASFDDDDECMLKVIVDASFDDDDNRDTIIEEVTECMRTPRPTLYEQNETPGGSIYWEPRVEGIPKPVEGTYYDTIDEALDMYTKYAEMAVLKLKREGKGESDAQMLINKMENRKKYVPNFTFQYKVENSELVAMFWADEVAKCNNKEFGDMVSFDAAFNSNKYNMKFVPFIGIDNHEKCVTLGSGMLLHEDTQSYTWLLTAFMTAFLKEPTMIVTDQDGAMKRAIEAVFKKAKHRLCMWHIMQKIPSKISMESQVIHIEIRISLESQMIHVESQVIRIESHVISLESHVIHIDQSHAYFVSPVIKLITLLSKTDL
ncbi:FAR1-related sequence 5-like protein [Tanacetum coccineum]